MDVQLRGFCDASQRAFAGVVNVRKLGLYIDDDGLLKSKERLNNAPILASEKRPEQKFLVTSKSRGAHIRR